MKKLNLKTLEVTSFVTSLEGEQDGTRDVNGGAIYTPTCPPTQICPIDTLFCPFTQITCPTDHPLYCPSVAPTCQC